MTTVIEILEHIEVATPAGGQGRAIIREAGQVLVQLTGMEKGEV